MGQVIRFGVGRFRVTVVLKPKEWCLHLRRGRLWWRLDRNGFTYGQHKGRPTPRVRLKQLRPSLYLLQDGRCPYCGGFMELETTTQPKSATLEHLRPRSRGGTHNPANVLLACKSCNNRRGNRSAWVGMYV